jgi:hypothetical protein
MFTKSFRESKIKLRSSDLPKIGLATPCTFGPLGIKYMGKNWAMYSQLDLEVTSEVVKNIKQHLIFMNFGLKNFIMKNDTILLFKTMFECYNLIDPIQ